MTLPTSGASLAGVSPAGGSATTTWTAGLIAGSIILLKKLNINVFTAESCFPGKFITIILDNNSERKKAIICFCKKVLEKSKI